MKIYHVETQQDYDALMVELEEKGCKWRGEERKKLTDFDEFKTYGKDTYIYEEYGIISFSDGYYFKAHRSNEPLIEYKAKGEEMKQNIIDWATDVSVAVESFYRDIKFEMKKSTVEADLQEAKTSAKKLIEKIDEYLETLKPEFKVGDYVTDTSNDNPCICKVEKFEGNDISGIWYYVSKKLFFDKLGLPVSNSRLSTPEEIAEYKAALTFHKNGRKPFEVKRGDVVYLKGYDKNIFLDSGNIYKKHNFIDGDVVLVKTAEEVNEWLGVSDE